MARRWRIRRSAPQARRPRRSVGVCAAALTS
jgi:hypothetical protein